MSKVSDAGPSTVGASCTVRLHDSPGASERPEQPSAEIENGGSSGLESPISPRTRVAAPSLLMDDVKASVWPSPKRPKAIKVSVTRSGAGAGIPVPSSATSTAGRFGSFEAMVERAGGRSRRSGRECHGEIANLAGLQRLSTALVDGQAERRMGWRDA